MKTFTCITLRLNGVRITKSITKPSVSMLIIGRISGENLITLLIILLKCVKSGRLVTLLASTRKVVLCRATVVVTMAGKSKCSILRFINRKAATMQNKSTQDKNYKSANRT